MIRRRFIFADQPSKKLYASPEFNGSLEEYNARGACLDSCDLSVADLQELFYVTGLAAFSKTCEEAQRHYHSFLGTHTQFSVAEVSPDQLSGLQADEIIFIINGQLISALPGWDGNINKLYAHIDNAVKIAQALSMPSDSKGGCTLEYSQVLEVSNEELGVIERYLNATREEDYQNEDNTITHTARFPDGMQMDIKCCSSQDGPLWAEAVLFDKNGYQLTYTEAREHYIGAWELEYGGIKYSVYVTNTGNVLHLHPIQSGLIDWEGICPVCGAEVNYCAFFPPHSATLSVL